MPHAPSAIVILVPVANGDRGAWGRSKPRYEPPPKSKRPPGWPRQDIPDPRRRREMMGEARRVMRETRQQREALREMGARLLAA
jgi:hypothetical protein